MFCAAYSEVRLEDKAVLIVFLKPLLVLSAELKTETNYSKVQLFIVLNRFNFEIRCFALAVSCVAEVLLNWLMSVMTIGR
jgi:hypothetical protein